MYLKRQILSKACTLDTPFCLMLLLQGGKSPFAIGTPMLCWGGGQWFGALSFGCTHIEALQLGMQCLKAKSSRYLIAGRTGFLEALDQSEGLCGGEQQILCLYSEPGTKELRELSRRLHLGSAFMWFPKLDMSEYSFERETSADEEQKCIQVEGQRNLWVVGGNDLGQMIAQIGRSVGVQSLILDPRSLYLERMIGADVEQHCVWPEQAEAFLQRGGSHAMAVVSHDPKIDDAFLEFGLKSDFKFLGVLGSSKSQQKRIMRFKQKGFDSQDLLRMSNPIGEKWSGQSLNGIALSVVQQIVQHFEIREAECGSVA